MAPKSIILAAAAALLLAIPVGRADAADPALVEAGDSAMTPLGMTARELEDVTLYGEGNEALGEVEQVLATRDGTVAGLVVEIEGALLGMIEREVLLRFDQVRRIGDRVTTRLSRAQLEAQPRWSG